MKLHHIQKCIDIEILFGIHLSIGLSLLIYLSKMYGNFKNFMINEIYISHCLFEVVTNWHNSVCICIIHYVFAYTCMFYCLNRNHGFSNIAEKHTKPENTYKYITVFNYSNIYKQLRGTQIGQQYQFTQRVNNMNSFNSKFNISNYKLKGDNINLNTETLTTLTYTSLA